MAVAQPSAITENSPTGGDSRHWHLILLAAGVIVAAAMLEVLPNERVALRGLQSYPLPHLCMSRLLYGYSCPGCGLTRSFVHLAHGDWHAAWNVHRCGWLLAALVVAQIPYRALVLAGLVRPLSGRVAQYLAFTILSVLVVNWALSLVIAS
ncbi:MAG: DUF2752 domain-containing protein [Pirellulales bacterium]